MMTLTELKQFVDRAYNSANRSYNQSDSIIVGIQVNRVGSVGATPTVEVESVQLGFDWNKNKFIITPKEILRESNRDESAMILKQYDQLGWDEYTLRNLKEENRKLRKEIDTLKSKS